MGIVVERLTRSGAELPPGFLDVVRVAADLGLPLRAELDLPADRFHLRGERAAGDRHGVVRILADPAFTRGSVRWQEAEECSVRSCEFVFPGRSGPAIAALERFSSRRLPGRRLDPARAGRVVDQLTRGDCSGLGDLPVWLAELPGPGRARRAWRELGGISIVLPWGMHGDPVAGTLAILEILILHLIDEFRQTANDQQLSMSSRRPEHMRDVRRVLDAADGSPGHDPALFARRLLLQRNLHVELDSSRFSEAIRWIAAATSRDPVLLCLDANLHAGDRSTTASACELPEDRALLAAWSVAREARLLDQPGHDFVLAAERIEERRKACGWPWLVATMRGRPRVQHGIPDSQRIGIGVASRGPTPDR